uniref:Uncharacterized protein n=1 Tax=Arundo donax TaxID=35708 RepID=A0A0A8YVR6_ARUDO
MLNSIGATDMDEPQVPQ